MMESSGKQLWVGITDRETNGVFKYLNGQTVNAQISQGETLLYYFRKGEPNNSGGNEECVHFYVNGLNDRPCNTVTVRGQPDFYGLCEIKNQIF